MWATQNYPRPEAVGAAPRGQRCEPQRQLHPVALLRPIRMISGDPVSSASDRPIPTSFDAATAPRTGRRSPTLTVGLRDAAARNAARARPGLGLAGVRHPHAQSGSWLTVTDRPRHRADGHRRPAGQSGQRRRIRREDALTKLFQPGGVRAPGAGHARRPPSRKSIVGPGYWNVDLALSELFAVAGTQTWSSASRRSTCSTTSTGATRTTNLEAGTFGRITTQAGSPASCSSASRVLRRGESRRGNGSAGDTGTARSAGDRASRGMDRARALSQACAWSG